MNRIEHVCRIFTALAAFALSQTAAFGQAPCPCQKNSPAAMLPGQISPLPHQQTSEMTRLPDSWPRQWSGPALSNASRVGTSTADVSPVVASPISGWPAGASPDGSYIATSVSMSSEDAPTDSRDPKTAADASATSTNTKSDASKSASSKSDASKSDASKSAAPFGSPAFGGGGFGGGGASGGSSGGGSGGFSGGSTWTPRPSGSGGGGGFGSGGGGSTNGFLNTSRSASGSSSTGSDTSPDPALDSTPTHRPNPTHGKDCGLAEIPPPICELPSVLPEIPPTGGNPISVPDCIHGNGVGETPVVPEPGSIVLLAMALGVGGAYSIRRRKRLAVASSIPSGV